MGRPRGSSRGFLLDSINYAGADSGCPKATAFLNSQSHCFSCPFPECIYISDVRSLPIPVRLERNEKIAQLASEGKSGREIANIFHIDRSTVSRILRQ